MTLAERLTDLRVTKRVSLQVVADSVGVSKPHVWELEKGKTKNPSLELLKKLAIYYSVTLDSLAGLERADNDDVRVLFREFDMNLNELTEEDHQTLRQAIEMAQALIKHRKNSSENE